MARTICRQAEIKKVICEHFQQLSQAPLITIIQGGPPLYVSGKVDHTVAKYLNR